MLGQVLYAPLVYDHSAHGWVPLLLLVGILSTLGHTPLQWRVVVGCQERDVRQVLPVSYFDISSRWDLETRKDNIAISDLKKGTIARSSVFRHPSAHVSVG